MSSATADYYSRFRRPAYTNFRAPKFHRTVMGLFDPMNLVVKLDSRIADTLNSVQDQFCSPDWDTTFAFGTFFHETIHWWQHAGTTAGLISGLTVPVQAHVSQKEFNEFREASAANKPLSKFLTREDTTISDADSRRLNVIVHNWMDIEFSHCLACFPENARAVGVDKFFESAGHAVSIHYAHTINLLRATFEDRCSIFPDVSQWQTGFDELRQRRVQNFYFGSPLQIAPIGMYSLFEGHARFSELQYLHIASGHAMSWNEFDRRGLMGEMYTDAFNLFLRVTEFAFPDTPVDPTVYLFLLACDIALNPDRGYPSDIAKPEEFPRDVSPGARFYLVAKYIAGKPQLRDRVKSADQCAYVDIADEICGSLGWVPPHRSAAHVCELWTQSGGTDELIGEFVSGEFGLRNMPVRFLIAKHLEMMRVRASQPDFFCWPAKFFVSTSNTPVDLAATKTLFDQFQPPFIANALDGAIGPNLAGGLEYKRMDKVMSTFFRWQILYDLARQWVSRDGAFSFNYTWFDPSKTPDQYRDWVAQNFETCFGRNLDSIAICT